MVEIGNVIKVKDEFATVRIDRKDECSKCGMCLFPKNANFIDVSAKNDVGAKEGDTVKISRQEGGKLLSITLAFLVPIIFAVISAFIVYAFSISEIWMLILTLASDLVWYIILAMLEKKFKVKFSSKTEITEIIKKEQKEN